MTSDLPPRPLPGDVHSRCEGCGRDLVWAVTVAGPNGRGGKLMPLDPLEDLTGNVAVTAPRRGRLLARVLTKEEVVDRPVEYCGMPHFATCPVNAKPDLPPEVIDLQQQRQQRRGRGRRTPRRTR